MNDLVVLTPDRNMEAAVGGALARHDSLAIRPLDFKIYVHPARDPGCLRDGHDFLRPFSKSYSHGLILLDREGCGRDKELRSQLETEIEKRLRSTGWDDRAAAVVIDPELEIWIWSDSPHVPKALGWENDLPSLRRWLAGHHLWGEGHQKPGRPKEAMEKALREKKKPRSSSVYSELAMKVSLKGCRDPAFLKLKDTLSVWFPAPGT